ncbi:TBC1 domain family member 22A-like [Tigriopus californicus]|uniref:TBC1 domain family member 22A-like n=1 Tax=Tigriopus californicus TaxID=6832 RepID=UPI0027DA1540|nr:TBC1 domain family member 22A-like [Tigriopus californicus]
MSTSVVKMSSNKYEKANLDATSSSSFWKKSSMKAVPGRPNPSSSVLAKQTLPAGSSGSGTSTNGHKLKSFSDFEASVSDAWNSEEPLPASLAASGATATGGRPTTSQASSSTSSVTTPKAPVIMSSVFKPETTKGSVSSRNGSPSSPIHSNSSDKSQTSPVTSGMLSSRWEKVDKLLSHPNLDLDELRKASWSGLPPTSRPKAWKILCGYLPSIVSRQDEVLQRKQDEYKQYVVQYFQTKDQDIHQETYRQIHIDIPRMSPVIALFQQKCVQEIFERILYIWAIRHPASGYVQGINDLVTPFFLVFLQDICPGRDVATIQVELELSDEQKDAIEADSFWCLTKVLGGIQDNYTFAQPGIQLKVKQLEELVFRLDQELHDHLQSHEVTYLQFAFRWMNNILMRELPIKATIRLWDTYLSELEGFSHFHLYVCAAFLTHWKCELMKRRDFHTLLMFLQNLPTAKWGDREIDLLVAEAFRLSYLFANAPRHFTTTGGTSTTAVPSSAVASTD